jgi:type IV pilus assembly protein PilY1
MSISLRTKFCVISSLAVVGIAGLYLHDAFSAQAEGELAQSPLNVDSQVPPAFIMAVDDSGSMTFQNQFPASDGRACWVNGGSVQNSSFFSDSGVLYDDTGSVPSGYDRQCKFSYSYTGTRITNGSITDNNRTIPAIDGYGFARSPDFNKAYFNPAISYEPWLDSSGNPYGATKDNPNGDAVPSSAPYDPRYPDDGVINLASQLENVSDRSLSRVLPNMFLPAGTRYYRYRDGHNCTADKKRDGLKSGEWATIESPGYTVTEECNLYFSHWPATFYLRSDVIPEGYEDVERALVTDSCGEGCDLWRYRIKAKDVKALQNFANWYVYYGNRNRAMVAAMSRSLVDVENMYISYFPINNHELWDAPNGLSSQELLSVYDMRSSSAKSTLFSEFTELAADGYTPNQQAVAAAMKQLNRTDADAPIKSMCQKNAVMLFTDGYSNAWTKAGVGNVDSSLGVPFKDTHSNTMADVAARYYNDHSNLPPLRPDLTVGQVPVPNTCPSADLSVDCQSNLHANFYGVTLGARGNLFNPDVEQDAYTDASIYDYWPDGQDGSRSAVDVIWHAAVNGRGKFINANTPEEITSAMRNILSSVGDAAASSGSIAATGSRISSSSLSVTPYYRAVNHRTDWYGELKAQSVSTNSNGVVSYASLWEASVKLPAHTARNIYYGTGAASSEFAAGSVTLTQLCSNAASMSLCSADKISSELGVDADTAIAYLRGDRSLERHPTTPLRTRTTLLGDIVNSSPVISMASDDYGFESIFDAKQSKYDVADYAGYLQAKSARDGVVYVGANDGMLHAFNSSTGVEKFAFIPESVLGHTGNLLFPYREEDENDQDFSHRYYVDGPITVSDVNSSGTNWITALVGTTGAGGKGVYALNVGETIASSPFTYLWEINGASTDRQVADNIGHVLGRPVIVPVRNASGAVSWKVIFGNGYNETDMAASANGLGNIVVIDGWGGENVDARVRDGYADTVYAADLKGAVWKFDLRNVSADPSTTALIDSVTTPLFVAKDSQGNRQPITGGLEASSAAGGGVMVYFGTGSFSYVNDVSDTSVQTLYAVQDTAVAAVTSTLYRENLNQKTISNASSSVRNITVSATTADSRGWYLDLTNSGERFVGYPEIADGVVYFATYQPNASTGCTTGGENWLYGLNANTGAGALSGLYITKGQNAGYGSDAGAVKLSTDGSGPVKDISVMSTPRLYSEGASAADCSLVINVAGATPLYKSRACGRQSWRQLR